MPDFGIGEFLSIAGPVVNGLLGSDASQNAANTQANAANQASQVQQNMFNTTQANLAPYMGTGGIALSDLQYLMGIGPNSSSGDLLTNSGVFPGALGGGNSYGGLGRPFDMSNFQASPAYNFNLQQGTNAINKAAASRGNFYAPQTLQDISKFSQGLASNEFQNSFNNYRTNQNDLFNRLSGLAGSGQNAAANLGGFSGQAANAIGNNLTSAGAAQAAGQIGSANALSGGIGQGVNNLQQFLAMQQSPSFSGGGGGFQGLMPWEYPDLLGGG